MLERQVIQEGNIIVYYHNSIDTPHPITSRWTYDADTNTLVHYSGYWVPLNWGDLPYWLNHLRDKRWVTDADLSSLESAFKVATQVAA